jgi:hypothetical protein
MRIERKKFESLIKVPERPSELLEVGKILYRVHRYFCSPMTISGKCPKVCAECKPLPKVFKELHNSTDVRNPHALLVWLLRTAVADTVEDDELSSVRVEKDWLGMDVESNPASFRETVITIGARE